MVTKKTPDEYGLLREMILKGQVMPNERLVENDFAERLGTNRANIRGAFARLEQDGLVVSEPFKGFRVRKLTEEEAIEIYEVRGALELLLIPRTVARITNAEKAHLRSMVKAMKAALKLNPTSAGSAARALRLEMWRISGHANAQRILNNLNSQLVRFRFHGIMIPGRSEALAEELEIVVEAVCAGSADKAVRAMRRSHEMAMANLKTAIDQLAS